VEILVLLKQVPATESMIAIADDGVSIKTDGLKYVINPYDELAVEEALKIRETQGGRPRQPKPFAPAWPWGPIKAFWWTPEILSATAWR
jgi:hypothetical protein